MFEQLRKVSGGRPVGNMQTLDDMLARSISGQKFNMLLLSVFAFTALLLSAVGVYGVIAYSVVQRTHEIGVRMALGAQRVQVLWLVMRKSLLIGVIGVAIGLPLALACSRLFESMLYQLSPFDPLSFVLSVCSIALAGSLAAFIPARRAAKVDPMVALRYE